MEILTNEKLNEINGGGKAFWLILGGAAAFLAGIFSGFMNPSKCNR